MGIFESVRCWRRNLYGGANRNQLHRLDGGENFGYFYACRGGLQGLGLYQYLVDFAGAGATVPISGFGYLLANGGIKGAEKGFFGAVTGALSSASAGISAAVIFSFLMAMIFRSRTKRN